MRAGWFSDPEDARTTYRRKGALGILRQWGGEPTWNHSDNTGLVGTGLLQREAHVCDYRCKPVYPEWVTDEVLATALRASDAMQTARGSYHQREAARLKAER